MGMFLLRGIVALWHDEDALVSVEYAVLLGLIVVVALVAWTMFGDRIVHSVRHARRVFRIVARSG